MVGRVGRAAGLAALGPNTAIYGGICQIFSFLTTATTASVARLAGQKTPTGRYVSAALLIAVSLGAACTLGLNLGYVGVLEVRFERRERRVVLFSCSSQALELPPLGERRLT